MLRKVLLDPRQPLDVRAAAGYALLTLDPADEVTLGAFSDATPPLVVALAYAASRGAPDVVELAREIRPFLDEADARDVDVLAEQRNVRIAAPPREELPGDPRDDDVHTENESSTSTKRVAREA